MGTKSFGYRSVVHGSNYTKNVQLLMTKRFFKHSNKINLNNFSIKTESLCYLKINLIFFTRPQIQSKLYSQKFYLHTFTVTLFINLWMTLPCLNVLKTFLGYITQAVYNRPIKVPSSLHNVIIPLKFILYDLGSTFPP